MKFDTDKELEQVVDHAWLTDGLTGEGPTYDPSGMKVNNDTKPDLSLEWGLAGPDIDIDKPAGVVERNLVPEDESKQVIMFARDLMNKGVQGSRFVAAMRDRYSEETMRTAEDGLRDQLKYAGMVGCFVLDARGYSSCKTAMEAASKSPFHTGIKHVIGCTCGTPIKTAKKACDALGDIESTGNAIDDMLLDDEDAIVAYDERCQGTMLKRLANDIDPSEVDEGMIDLMRVAGLSMAQQEVLKGEFEAKSKSSGVNQLKMAYTWLNDREESAVNQYSDVVDTTEFMMEQADFGVDAPEMSSSEEFLPLNPEDGIDSMDLDDIGIQIVDGLDMSPIIEEEFAGQEIMEFEPEEALGLDDGYDLGAGIQL